MFQLLRPTRFALLIFGLLFFSNSILHAQDPKQVTVNLKKGIYRNFSEMITNSPSLDLNFHVITRSEWQNYSFYQLYQDSIGKMKIKRDKNFRVFGFCDGKDIYIIHKGETVLSSKVKFDKLLSIGQYCTYQTKIEYAGNYDPSTGVGLPNGSTIADMVLNTENGEQHFIKPSWLKEILKDSAPVLYEEFMAESNKKNMAVHYVKKYNKTHPLRFNSDTVFDVVLYRLKTHESHQTIDITIDNVIYHVPPATLINIKFLKYSSTYPVYCNGEVFYISPNILKETPVSISLTKRMVKKHGPSVLPKIHLPSEYQWEYDKKLVQFF